MVFVSTCVFKIFAIHTTFRPFGTTAKANTITLWSSVNSWKSMLEYKCNKKGSDREVVEHPTASVGDQESPNTHRLSSATTTVVYHFFTFISITLLFWRFGNGVCVVGLQCGVGLFDIILMIRSV